MFRINKWQNCRFGFVMLGQIQYFFFMSEKTEKKELAILRLLQKAEGPVSSLRLKENLHAMGHEVSERTIRHYFLELDRRGLTENRGKKGRIITELGLRGWPARCKD
jgi:repressor of nif and glnA expression